MSWWGLVLGLVLALPLWAQAQCPGLTTVLEPLAEETLTVGSTPVLLTPGVYQQATGTAAYATLQVQGAAIVYRQAGTPSPTSGVVVGTQGMIPICGLPSIRAFRATRQSATDATVFVIYYRVRSP
jgi:hypothetical protein